MQELSDSVVLITIIGLISGASATFFNQLFAMLDRRHERFLRNLEIDEKRRRAEKDFLLSISSQLVQQMQAMNQGHSYRQHRAAALALVHLVWDEEIEKIFETINTKDEQNDGPLHEGFYKVIEHLGHRIRDF